MQREDVAPLGLGTQIILVYKYYASTRLEFSSDVSLVLLMVERALRPRWRSSRRSARSTRRFSDTIFLAPRTG